MLTQRSLPCYSNEHSAFTYFFSPQELQTNLVASKNLPNQYFLRSLKCYNLNQGLWSKTENELSRVQLQPVICHRRVWAFFCMFFVVVVCFFVGLFLLTFSSQRSVPVSVSASCSHAAGRHYSDFEMNVKSFGFLYLSQKQKMHLGWKDLIYLSNLILLLHSHLK